MSDVAAPELRDNAKPFDGMAEKVRGNQENGFAGAFVIVPPTGRPQTLLLLDEEADSVIFWSTLQTRVQIALKQIEDEEHGANVYGRR